MMAVLGAFLGALGVSDMFRASQDKTTTLRRATVLAIGLAVLALLLAAGGTTGLEWFTLGLPLGLAVAGWTLGSATALDKALGREAARARLLAFAALVTGAAVGLLLGDPQDAAWPAFASGPITGISLDRTILVLGLTLAQFATANVIVRLTLDGVGVPTATSERKLKSGRVLGPMERLFILGLGMAGSVTAAAAVVAAKGLLRYPEVKAIADKDEPNMRANPVSEYFLIGSFASWLVAAAALGITTLNI